MVYSKTILLAMITVLLAQADQPNRYSNGNAPGDARTESRGGLIRVVVKPSDARGKVTGPGGAGSVFRGGLPWLFPPVRTDRDKSAAPGGASTELPGAVTRVVVKLTDARGKVTAPGAAGSVFSGGLPGLVPPTDVAQPNATALDMGRYVFPGGLPGMVITPVRDIEILEESYARVMEIRKHVVTDFEVADCTTTGDEMVKETTTIYCPAGCATHVKATVWGTGTYKGDSSMCRAAVHNGKLDDSAGGFVTVDKRPLGMMFPGSVRNGVRSTLAVINANRFPKGDKKSFVLRKYKFGE